MSDTSFSMDTAAVDGITGTSSRLCELKGKVRKIAPTACTVLLTGETGTGKEVVARALHASSERRTGPFVSVNCAAISRELLESELFGHVQGAFTSASRSREGHFQMADGGTLFLDEIGEMPLDLQAKLLRAIQFQEFCPVGDSRPRKVDLRILAATNADLEARVREKTFRSDLFYRLNVVQLNLPPLRDRVDDIADLTRCFIGKYSRKHRRVVVDISEKALRMLERHTWPGNIRELENAIEFAVVMGSGERIEPQDLPALTLETDQDVQEFLRPLCDQGINLTSVLRKIESHFIVAALERTEGNKNQAAALLGLNRTTLVEKIKRGLSEEVIQRAC